MNILQVLGRSRNLFDADLRAHGDTLQHVVESSSFLILGGAGSIGQAVVKEIFKRSPKKLHVVDISENNLAELVRDIRSTLGYINGDFRTFALDIGSWQYDAFINAEGGYDYVLNLSALKHVRSEKDPFTLMRMIETNVFNTVKTVSQSRKQNTKKYFAVSTDKAANPVNMMGGSKRIMELFLFRESMSIPISTARFANVAFSDGSLLHSFKQRIEKNQPLVAPSDVRRYFVTPEESGLICLFSAIMGDNRDIFFPKLDPTKDLLRFSDIAVRFLNALGYEAHLVESEEEARMKVNELQKIKKWPCLFTASDTTGEKDIEEFYTGAEELDMTRFADLGIVKNNAVFNNPELDSFTAGIEALKAGMVWTKNDLLDLYKKIVPGFEHEEKGKNLDNKM